MEEKKSLHCHVYKHLGQYNIARNSKQWQVCVNLPDKETLSEIWPEGEEPEIDGIPPSEVIQMIEERLSKYLFHGGKEEKRALIEKYRPMFAQLDDAWARWHIARLEQQAAAYRYHLLKD